MTNLRKDFNEPRNKEIYDLYKGGSSYSDLAKKYNLTSQRIQSIVKHYEKQGFAETLSTSDPKSKEENFKKQAELIRSRGNLYIAENMFNQVLQWDLKNENITGAVDVYGHLSITYSLIAKDQKDKNKKTEYFEKSQNSLQEAVSLSIKHPKIIDEGRRAILNVHLVSSILDKIRYLNPDNKKEELDKALVIIDSSIKDLPGSQAHKAWAKRHKGEILYSLGKRKEALDVLLDAEKDVFLGYKEEVKGNKDNEFKILIWLTGIQLTLAGMAYEMNQPALARNYAAAVIATEDPTNDLEIRKRQAKEILAKLEN